MKLLILTVCVAIFASCTKTELVLKTKIDTVKIVQTDTVAVIVPPMLSLVGSWKIVNNGVVATFDIVKNPNNSKDTLAYTANAKVTYKDSTSVAEIYNTAIEKVNGFYKINVWSRMNIQHNNMQFMLAVPNSTIDNMNVTKLTCQPSTNNNYNTGSWVSVTGYVSQASLIIPFKSPVILTRVK